jgi:uncharacterized protein (TIGR02145 family)
MKKILLLMMCCPAMLAAQNGNGVTVSNLAVHAGTVTFNVSWKKADMPTMWSDTVWVFVDYNKNGVMTRLPVTNATATAGTVTKVQGNDKGAWVVGNARSAGNFSATVKLFASPATADLAGVCAYASNYPPVGEYTSADEISFTGTPPYNLVLVSAGSGTRTYSINDSYYILYEGETLQSFSDKTGAPGTKINECHAPGSTVTFTAFNPCTGASYGATYTLKDSRDNKQYKVKYLPDGRYWMVQNLAFGDRCNDTNFDSGSTATGNINSAGTYYGDCRTSYCSNSFWYNRAAALNSPQALSSTISCTGTDAGTGAGKPSSCQGICPVGWHIPTWDEYDALSSQWSNMPGCNGAACWTSTAGWNAEYCHGICHGCGDEADVWTSSWSTQFVYWNPDSGNPGQWQETSAGVSARCVLNY